MPTVRYEGRYDIEEETPDDVHAHADPLLTLVWHQEAPGIARKVQIPINRVVRIDYDGDDL